MTTAEIVAEGNAIHEDFAVLMARMVMLVGTERAIAILQRAAAVFTAEAIKSGHTPPRRPSDYIPEKQFTTDGRVRK